MEGVTVRRQKIFTTIWIAVCILYVAPHSLAQSFATTPPSIVLCDSIRNEMNSLKVPLFANETVKQNIQQRSGLAYHSISEKIFKAYIESDVKPSSFIRCMQNEGLHRQAVTLETNYLPSAFFNRTLRILKNSESTEIKEFARDAETALNSGAITFLDIDVPSDAGSNGTTALQLGGFHRGQNGLYMNPNELPSSQWFIIFFHEFAHALDPNLRHAVIEEIRVPLIPTLKDAIKDPSWDDEDEREIKKMIRISMDRGFAGEYRAWMVALSLYYKQNPSVRIAWAEQMAGNRQVFDRAAQRALFDFLDPRFENKPEGVFADPRVQRIYENIRGEWRRHPPDLGGLKKYL